MVGLIDKDNNVIAKFQATPIKGSIATFKCIEVNGPVDFENVTGTLQYMPKDQNGDGYTQKGNDNTAHLVYANNIIAQLSKANLKGGEDQPIFQNTTSIFRIKIKAPRELFSNASLTMYGADNWGTGISLTMQNISLQKNDILVAYMAVPSGKTDGNLYVALTDGSKEGSTSALVTTYSGSSKKQFNSGSEYTADFSDMNGSNWNEETDGDNGFVDFNLPSKTLWATKNLGAKELTGSDSFGYYYAWGYNKHIVKGFTSTSLPACTAYRKNLDELKTNNIIGYIDGVWRLSSTSDPASNPDEGGNKDWFTPTKEQWQELLSNCIWVWNASLQVYEVRSKKENITPVLFMPAAGYYEGSTQQQAGQYTYYWTSTPPVSDSYDEQNAWCMHISGPHRSLSEFLFPRYLGLSIRPVKQGTTNNN